jgi:hypothetical protein
LVYVNRKEVLNKYYLNQSVTQEGGIR